MLHTGEIESTPDPSVFKLSDLEFPIKCKNNLIMGKQKTKGGLMAYRINPPQYLELTNPISFPESMTNIQIILEKQESEEDDYCLGLCVDYKMITIYKLRIVHSTLLVRSYQVLDIDNPKNEKNSLVCFDQTGLLMVLMKGSLMEVYQSNDGKLFACIVLKDRVEGLIISGGIFLNNPEYYLAMSTNLGIFIVDLRLQEQIGHINTDNYSQDLDQLLLCGVEEQLVIGEKKSNILSTYIYYPAEESWGNVGNVSLAEEQISGNLQDISYIGGNYLAILMSATPSPQILLFNLEEGKVHQEFKLPVSEIYKYYSLRVADTSQLFGVILGGGDLEHEEYIYIYISIDHAKIVQSNIYKGANIHNISEEEACNSKNIKFENYNCQEESKEVDSKEIDEEYSFDFEEDDSFQKLEISEQNYDPSLFSGISYFHVENTLGTNTENLVENTNTIKNIAETYHQPTLPNRSKWGDINMNKGVRKPPLAHKEEVKSVPLISRKGWTVENLSVGMDIGCDSRSIFSSDNSKLRIDVNSIYDNSSKLASGKLGTRHSSLLSKNMPVTFHKKIKSSGYGREPDSRKYTKLLSQHKAAPVQKQKSLPKSNFYMTTYPQILDEMYPRSGDKYMAPITCVEYSHTGNKLAVGYQDNTMSILYMTGKQESLNLPGHSGPINSIFFSNSDSMMLTASNDKTARLWNMSGGRQGEALLNINKIQNNYSNRKTNKFYSNPIIKSCFLNNDKLFALISGNSLYFYTYQLSDRGEQDDVKRLQSKVYYKLVQEFKYSIPQSLTSFCIHQSSLISPISITACSNKDLLVYDISQNQIIHQLNNSDDYYKHIYQLRYFEPGGATTLSSQALNLFGGLSMDSSLRIYDLRNCSQVASLDNHLNRMSYLDFAFSQCLRYIYMCSEDRSFYTYDLRKQSIAFKSKGSEHGDSVTAISSSPTQTKLATGCADGKVRIYKSNPERKVTHVNGGMGSVWGAICPPQIKNQISVRVKEPPQKEVEAPLRIAERELA